MRHTHVRFAKQSDAGTHVTEQPTSRMKPHDLHHVLISVAMGVALALAVYAALLRADARETHYYQQTAQPTQTTNIPW